MSKGKKGKGKGKTNVARADSQLRQQREIAIIEGALEVFGEKGVEATRIADISKAARVSDATLYEYFSSKEEILFSIPKLYTSRHLERMKEIAPYIVGARNLMRFVIRAYLEFYETNRLYSSVALLSLKGNRNFLKSPSYQVVREAARPIVEVFDQGVTEGVFRDDIDGYLVRNMVLGFIEHLTIQWLLLGRPERITDYVDTIYDMVSRAIEKPDDRKVLQLEIRSAEPLLAKLAED